MSFWLEKYSAILSWAIPSSVILLAASIQWIYGWRRLMDRIVLMLDQKADRAEVIEMFNLTLPEETFHKVRKECVDTMTASMKETLRIARTELAKVHDEQARLWQEHGSMAIELAGSSGRIDEAVQNLKEAVKEIKRANGRGQT